MRILVHPHEMLIGGSQLNAIDLAERMQARGHDVIVYGNDGVLVDDVRDRGLEMILAPERRMTPSPPSSVQLLRLARERSIDVLHTYEAPATVDALSGPGWILGTPVLSTILAMEVRAFLPWSVPMIVGTRQIYAQEQHRRPELYLMEPPIDVELNSPRHDGRAGRDFRERWGIGPEAKAVVVVGRIAADLKLEGLLAAVRATGALQHRFPIRLVVVGDGPEREVVESCAREVNAHAARELVTLTGEIRDPRPAYAAADVVLGMGGSVLRGMAFGKPVIVQGEKGFWEPLTDETLPMFLHQGWYGVGDGRAGEPRLVALLAEALADPDSAARRGALGRQVVVEHYSLTAAAESLEAIYHRVRTRHVPASGRGAEAVRAGAALARHAARVLSRRVRAEYR
jgi:glycosyltransferase involved in cell wall biosynthesis